MTRRRATRRMHEWMIRLAITVVVLAAVWFRPTFLEAIEYQRFDLRLQWFGSLAPAQHIAFVPLDEESITTLERWSWPRSWSAALVVHTVAATAARQVAVTLGSVQE